MRLFSAERVYPTHLPKLVSDDEERRDLPPALRPRIGFQYYQAGHMFYLKGEDAASGMFQQGNKWYFCENGVWHSSFFYVGN